MEFRMSRLLIFILVFAIFLAFIVFNLDNKSDVSFGIKTFNDVPVFLTVFSSFVLGMLFAVPLVLRRKKPSRAASADNPSFSGDAKKRRGLGFKKSARNADEKDGVVPGSGEPKKENSSYGID